MSKMTIYALFILLTVPFIRECFAQNYLSKQGGIGFRIDDDQSFNQLKNFTALFDSYNIKYSYAINPTFIKTNNSYISFIKSMEINGHELMDHTPNHITSYFDAGEDSQNYLLQRGVDHVNEGKICLEYDPDLNFNLYQNEGPINIINNMAISLKPGEFKNFSSLYDFALYVPILNKVFRNYEIYNQNSADVDTIILKSFWDENVKLNPIYNTRYELLNRRDVKMTPAALNILFNRSSDLFKSLGLSIPKVWIQPGASSPLLRNIDLKNTFYKAGATVVTPSKLYFNEYDPNNDKAYGMDWGQITPEKSYFSEMKSIIANEVAKHHVLFATGHFNGNLLNGWDGLLKRIDSLLAWTVSKKIPVRTYSQWADQLYNEKPNPYENVFPKLGTDLNDDGLPDGYESLQTKIDGNDGVPESGGISFCVENVSSIFKVEKLAGLEKGENIFEFYAKGKGSSKIKVEFEFPEIKTTESFIFQVDSSSWEKFELNNSLTANHALIIPEEVSYCNILVSCISYSGEKLKMSGFKLRKKSNDSILPPWGFNGLFTNGKVKLSWINNSDNEEGYIIERKIDSIGEFKAIAKLPKNANSYIDTLEENYYKIKYNVYAYNDTVRSERASLTIEEPEMTDTARNHDVINQYSISANYPNPFNSSTLIIYSLPEDCRLQFKVFDMLGREVITFAKESKKAGTYKQYISMLGMPSGVYIYQYVTDHIVKSGKMIYLK